MGNNEFDKLSNNTNKMSYYCVRENLEDMFQQRRSRRSCSLPREDSGYTQDRLTRARSVGPMDRFSPEPAMPFTTRAASVPPFDYLGLSRSRYARNLSPLWHTYDYTPRYYYWPRTYKYDYDRQNYLPSSSYYSSYEPYWVETRTPRTPRYGYYTQDRYSYGYDNSTNYDLSLRDYYGNNKYNDYAYSSSTDVLGRWKHYNRSSDTLNTRNCRATSPLISRELNRYFSSAGKTDSVADLGSRGALDFRHYNYRSVPYFGTSDNFHNLNKMFQEQNRREGRAF